MSDGYRLRPAAVTDLDKLATYIADSSPIAAERFLDSALRTFDFLSRFPNSGAMVRSKLFGSQRFRVWPVRGFPNHLIYYYVDHGLVFVARVVHGATDHLL